MSEKTALENLMLFELFSLAEEDESQNKEIALDVLEELGQRLKSNKYSQDIVNEIICEIGFIASLQKKVKDEEKVTRKVLDILKECQGYSATEVLFGIGKNFPNMRERVADALKYRGINYLYLKDDLSKIQTALNELNEQDNEKTDVEVAFLGLA
ncbi:MAG: hypothetical protein OEY94_04030 [Alphaproteobacteria bacterium]|nr:hypothetical protein [Alphaproteobacteria bacterium]